MSIAAGMIDQRFDKLVADVVPALDRRGIHIGDTSKQRSLAFVYLVVSTLLELDVDDAIRELDFVYRRQQGGATPQTTDIASDTAAEAVLTIWRQRPQQARFQSREHFGNLYDFIFSDDLNAAQVVIAALILKTVQDRCRNLEPDTPDFLPYASYFVAMMVGHYLLQEMKLSLKQMSTGPNHSRKPGTSG